MRRMAPPARLRVDPVTAPGRCAVGLGPSGLRLEAAAGDAVAAESPWTSVRMVSAGPVPCAGLDTAQSGALAVVWGPGMVRSVRVSDTGQLFDRRPPGTDRAVGAAQANAALVHADGGWRAVVLPSLGDRLPDLGPGPAAIAPDGLSVAVGDGGGIAVMNMADGAVTAHHEGAADAVALGAGGAVWVAAGGAVGPPGTAAGDGARVIDLRAAGAADAAVALHEDGAVGVTTAGGVTRWQAPEGAVRVAVSDDGRRVLITAAPGITVCDARDGAVLLSVGGVTCGGFGAGDVVVVGGDWGVATLAPPADGT